LGKSICGYSVVVFVDDIDLVFEPFCRCGGRTVVAGWVVGDGFTASVKIQFGDGVGSNPPFFLVVARRLESLELCPLLKVDTFGASNFFSSPSSTDR
jgi:hypothetical protein